MQDEKYVALDLKTGACQSNPEMPVNSYPARVENGEVQILIKNPNSPTKTNSAQPML